jgi:Domain of unknown function (DUF4919)
VSIPLGTLFAEYMRQPSPNAFLHLRQRIIDNPKYDPYSGADKDLEALVCEGRFAEVRPAFDAMLPSWLLSPKAHTLASVAAMQLGDQRTSLMEQFLASRCLGAILQTGDGSDEQPFIVTVVADEYDVLKSYGRRSLGQALRAFGDRYIDVHHLDDESTACFDVTDLQAVLQSRLR